MNIREKVGKFLWEKIISTRYLGSPWEELWPVNRERIMEDADALIKIVKEDEENVTTP